MLGSIFNLFKGRSSGKKATKTTSYAYKGKNK